VRLIGVCIIKYISLHDSTLKADYEERNGTEIHGKNKREKYSQRYPAQKWNKIYLILHNKLKIS